MLDSEVQITTQLHLLVNVYTHLLRDLPLACLGRIILIIDLMGLQVHTLLVTPYNSEVEAIDDL